MSARAPSVRWGFGAMFAVCAGLVAFALYLQHVEALEPCPLCILQRYAFIAIGGVALLGAWHDPPGTARRVYSGLVVVFALAGGAVAVRHIWLQYFPPASRSCGADLGYLLNNFPLATALPTIFQGTGECSKVPWRFLALSLPEWALIWFVILGIAAVWMGWRRA